MIKKIKNLLKSHFSILENTFWLYLSEITSRSLHLILFLIIARLLGKEILGLFSYVVSLAGFYFIFSDFGISQLLIRDYQQKEDKENLIKNSLVLKILVNFFIFLISLSGYLVLKNKEYSFLLYFIMILYFLVYSLRGYFTSFFITIHKSFFNFLSNLIEGITIVIFILFLSLILKSSLAIGLAYLFSSLAAFFVVFFFFKKNISFELNIKELFKKENLNKANFIYYFKNGLPLTFFGLLGYIFFSTDQLILGHFRNFKEVGTYAVASKLILAVSFLSYLFSTAVFPLISKLISDLKRLKKYFYAFLILHFLLGFFTSLIMIPLSPLLIYIGFGKEYLDALPLVYSLVWILIFMFQTNFLDYVLLAFNLQWLDFFITLIPAVLNLILNFILVPNYGAFGAIFSSLVSQLINFFLTLLLSLFVIEKTSKKS